MTGTIVKLRLGSGSYDEKELKDKPITTVRVDGNLGAEFDVVGELGPLGAKVEITARLAVAS